MNALRGWLVHAPWAFGLTILSYLLAAIVWRMRRRRLPWVPYVAAALLIAGLEQCRFGGPRVEHFDYIDPTPYYWIATIMARVVVGFAVFPLGVLVARASAGVVGGDRASWSGFAAASPLGAALVVSGLMLYQAFVVHAAGNLGGGTQEALRIAHGPAAAILMGGASLSLVIGMALISRLLVRRLSQDPHTF